MKGTRKMAKRNSTQSQDKNEQDALTEGSPNLPATTTDPDIVARRMLDALSGGLAAAAKIYADYVAAGGDSEQLRRKLPFTSKVWRTLELVGIGKLDPRVFIYPAHTQKELRNLPVTAQNRLIEEGVDVASSTDGTGIRRQLDELTARQARMVFGPRGVRTPDEQRGWLKTQIQPQKSFTKTQTVPWEVFEKRGKKGLRVLQPIELSVDELHRIIGML